MRTGALYERRGDREISVVEQRAVTAALIEAIQQFRGSIYSLGGPIDAVVDGRNVHAADPVSDHILLVEAGIIGCARYERRADCVELGGFVVAPFARPRATLAIVLKVKEWAALCGDKRFIARASVEAGSASILRKFGARVLTTYYEPAYKRHAELIEILLPELDRAA